MRMQLSAHPSRFPLKPVFRYFGPLFPSLFWFHFFARKWAHQSARGNPWGTTRGNARGDEKQGGTLQDDQLVHSQQPIFERTRIVKVCLGNRLENVRGNALGNAHEKQTSLSMGKPTVYPMDKVQGKPPGAWTRGTCRTELTRTQGDMLSGR